MTRRSRRGNYPYAVARVRAKKAKLLPRETYQKLLKMSLAEVTQTIRDTDYRDQIDELASRFDGIDLIENALNVNEEYTYAQVRAFTEGEAHDLTAAFLGRHDFRDIKVVLRGKHYGASEEEIMRELLVEDREEYELLRRLLADNVQGVDGVIRALEEAGGRGRVYAHALRQAEALAESPGLSEYEDALDRYYYEHLLDTVRGETRTKQLFRRFIEKEIDAVNLLAVLRYQRAGLGWERIEPLLVPAGHDLDMARLRQVHEAGSLDEVAQVIGDTKIGSALEESLATGSLSKVDIAAKRHVMDFASGFSHLNPLSILPIIDYLLRKHSEVRNLRAIARGKEAGLSDQAIQDMLVL